MVNAHGQWVDDGIDLTRLRFKPETEQRIWRLATVMGAVLVIVLIASRIKIF